MKQIKDLVNYPNTLNSLAQLLNLSPTSFKGLAATSTVPTVQTGVPQWWLASGAGTYTNFGGLVITENFAVLSYSGSAWSKWETTITAPNVVQTPGTSETNVMSQKSISEIALYKKDIDVFVCGGIATDGFINNPTGAGTKTMTMSPLKNIQFIEAKDVHSYHSGQHTIYWIKDDGDGTYSSVGTEYRNGNFLIQRSEFVSEATHYVIWGIESLSPTMSICEYRSLSLISDEIKTSLNSFKNSIKVEDFTNYINISIIDTSKIKTNTRLKPNSGREFSQTGASYNVTDFCEIIQNVEYSIGYVTEVYMYDIDRNYLGQYTITDNKKFTITNTNCFFVRLIIPNPATQCYVAGYGVKSFNGTTAPVYVGKRQYVLKDLYKIPVQGWGDSICGRGGSYTKINSLTGRIANYFTYGGCDSSLIRDQFLENATLNNCIQIFENGHNSIDNISNLINDTRTMIQHLPHQMFIVVTPPIGTSPSESYNTERVAIAIDYENKCDALYGSRVVHVRKAAIAGYNIHRAKLLASFTQPAVGSTVNVNVSDVPFIVFNNTKDAAVSFIPAQNLIKIGFDGSFDTYEIQSSSITPEGSGGDGKKGIVNLKLITSERIAPGATVENITATKTPTGASTPIEFIKYLEIFKSADKYLIDLGMTPSTFRDDGVHPSIYGGEFTGEVLSWKLNEFKI